jgi:hypothetical protein
VWLMVRIAARWVRRGRFPLGASPAGNADPKAYSAAT